MIVIRGGVLGRDEVRALDDYIKELQGRPATTGALVEPDSSRRGRAAGRSYHRLLTTDVEE